MERIQLTSTDREMASALANLAAAGFTFTEVDACDDQSCTEPACATHPLAA